MKVDHGVRGVRALVKLAKHVGGGPQPTSEIASTQEIPEPYLDQVLSVLQKSGIMRSRRGPRGGYTLAKSASDIDLGMVRGTVDGTGAPLVMHRGTCGVYVL